MLNLLFFIVFISLGYLSGSICSAVLVSNLFGLPDPRNEGSKNPGATNVLRLSGKKYALIVLVMDVFKGLFPVALVSSFHVAPWIIGFTALAAVLGHMYPIFFSFEGGKGVATALGALLGLKFSLGLIVIITWLLVASITRYSSLASIIAMALAPIYALLLTKNAALFFPLFLITLAILYKHKGNITRLMEKKEPKIHFNLGGKK
jgi:glycerol-3-phosphate acyltransferase PlsY